MFEFKSRSSHVRRQQTPNRDAMFDLLKNIATELQSLRNDVDSLKKKLHNACDHESSTQIDWTLAIINAKVAVGWNVSRQKTEIVVANRSIPPHLNAQEGRNTRHTPIALRAEHLITTSRLCRTAGATIWRTLQKKSPITQSRLTLRTWVGVLERKFTVALDNATRKDTRALSPPEGTCYQNTTVRHFHCLPIHKIIKQRFCQDTILLLDATAPLSFLKAEA